MATLDKNADRMVQISNLCAEINGKLQEHGIVFKAPHIVANARLGFDLRYSYYDDNTIFVNPDCIDKYTMFYTRINRTESGYSNEPNSTALGRWYAKSVLAHRTVEHIIAKNGITSSALDSVLGSKDIIFCRALMTHICHFVSEVCAYPENTVISTSAFIRLAGIVDPRPLGKHFSDFMVGRNGSDELLGFRDVLESGLEHIEKAQLALLGVMLGSKNISETLQSLVSSPRSIADALYSIKDITWELVNFSLVEAVYKDAVLGEE